jgi:hypothetical protein
MLLNPAIHIAVAIIELGLFSVEPNLAERHLYGCVHPVRKPPEIVAVVTPHTMLSFTPNRTPLHDIPFGLPLAPILEMGSGDFPNYGRNVHVGH